MVRKIEHTIAQVIPREPNKLLAIGVGVPGLVDSNAGVAVNYKYIKHWNHIPLAGRLTQRFGVPVYLENCVRSMALAELWFGHGLGVKNFLCVGIRSGIGVGMVLDGALYCGANRAAGEFGRSRCPIPSGPAAEWFRDPEKRSALGPELQDVASFLAIQRAVKNAVASGHQSVLCDRPQLPSLADLCAAVAQRDPLITSIVEEATRCLGWAIGQLSVVVDPEKVVLAGPLTALGDTILRPLRKMAGAVLSSADLNVPKIVNSTLGEFSGALGAAALALHEWKPER